MSHQSGCLVCGQELEHHGRARDYKCQYCSKTFESEVACLDGHYICDDCHRLPAVELIATYCATTTVTDPLAIAETLMAVRSNTVSVYGRGHFTSMADYDKRLKMHGPEHHFLVPAALLAAYYNHIGQPEQKEAALARAGKRAARVPGGFCGTHGDCGASVGTGIFISVITGATPLSGPEWGLANRMTAASLLVGAEIGGPRCCKRNSRLAILEAVGFLDREFDTRLPVTRGLECAYVQMNRECIKERCPYHP